jgi:hypothetical protein
VFILYPCSFRAQVILFSYCGRAVGGEVKVEVEVKVKVKVEVEVKGEPASCYFDREASDGACTCFSVTDGLTLNVFLQTWKTTNMRKQDFTK